MRIEILPSAKRELAELPFSQLQLVDERLLSLAHLPRPDRVKVLSAAQQLYRWQLGDYSIIYQIKDEQSVVRIVKITPHQKA